MRTNAYLLLLLAFVVLLGCSPGKEDDKLQNPLTVERLYSSPLLTGDKPRGLKISPDGERITFLKGKQDDYRVLDLWQFDLDSGEESLLVDSREILGEEEEELSDEEKARRERKRIYEKGIIEYQWSKQGNKILFPINGDIYLYQLNQSAPVKRITNTPAFESDPRFSPKGNYISFVRDHNVFAVRLDDMSEMPISTDGTKDKPMGVAEFIAQEEMDRHRGYWWSPNEQYLAVARVDNSPVGSIERFEVYPDRMSLVKQSYPKAGTDNAVVKLGIKKIPDSQGQGTNDITTRETVWVPVNTTDYYIPQVKWLPAEEESILAYSVQTRDQKKLDLWTYNVEKEQAKKLLEENDPAWINIRHDYLFLKNSQRLLWVSEKSGFSHIHVYDWSGNEQAALTKGDWEVLELLTVDEKNNKAYFIGNLDSPLEQHLYEVALMDTAVPKRISKEAGIHKITMAEKPEFYIDNFSSTAQPFRVSVHGLDGERKFHIKENRIDDTHPLGKYVADLSAWEHHKFQLPSGHTLFYKLLKPKTFRPGRKYPLIQFVYGGPGPQIVRKGWGDLYHQLLAQQGFIVLVADNRGTPHRGRDFEREYYLKFGNLEVEDQSAVLKHVTQEFRFIDKNRVGVYGHSYGGYLTLMLMLQKPDLYQVGVAGAPVVDWTWYDTHYTERYLGKPQENKNIYQRANVTSYAENLKGKLLVIHGMADDNVLYNHSLLLYRALQEKGKMFDMMAYPGAKHGIRGKKEWQVHYRNSTLYYFTDHLINKT